MLKKRLVRKLYKLKAKLIEQGKTDSYEGDMLDSFIKKIKTDSYIGRVRFSNNKVYYWTDFNHYLFDRNFNIICKTMPMVHYDGKKDTTIACSSFYIILPDNSIELMVCLYDEENSTDNKKALLEIDRWSESAKHYQKVSYKLINRLEYGSMRSAMFNYAYRYAHRRNRYFKYSMVKEK